MVRRVMWGEPRARFSSLGAPLPQDPYQRGVDPPLAHGPHPISHDGLGLAVGEGSSDGLALGEGDALIGTDGLALGVAVGLGVGVGVGGAAGGVDPTTGGGGPISGGPGGGGTVPGGAVGVGLASGVADASSPGVPVTAGLGEPVSPRTASLGVGD
jgi:hypothetical protein